jgi:tagaturonate reductase
MMALGFAGYMLFMRSVKEDNGKYTGSANGLSFTVQDDNVEYIYKKWQEADIKIAVRNILCDAALWGIDLTALPGFDEKVMEYMDSILQQGVERTMASLLKGNIAV